MTVGYISYRENAPQTLFVVLLTCETVLHSTTYISLLTRDIPLAFTTAYYPIICQLACFLTSTPNSLTARLLHRILGRAQANFAIARPSSGHLSPPFLGASCHVANVPCPVPTTLAKASLSSFVRPHTCHRHTKCPRCPNRNHSQVPVLSGCQACYGGTCNSS